MPINLPLHEPTPQSLAYARMVDTDPDRLIGLPTELSELEQGVDQANSPGVRDLLADQYLLAWQGVKEIRGAESPSFRAAWGIAKALEHLPEARQIITPRLTTILTDVTNGQNVNPGSLSLVLDMAQVTAPDRGIINPRTNEGRTRQLSARRALNSLILGLHPDLRAEVDKDANKALNDPNLAYAIGETEFVRYAGELAPSVIVTQRAARVARSLLAIRPDRMRYLPASAIQVGYWAMEQPSLSRSTKRKLQAQLPLFR